MRLEGDLKEQWVESILKVMDFFIDICQKHNLRYYIAYGSAIGAVRHKGLIPWDDDIDIFMPRPDYEKLVEICTEINMGDYRLITPFNTKKYYLPFAKMTDTRSLLLEETFYRCIIGPYIDIFVLDGCGNDIKEARRLAAQYDRLRGKVYAATHYHNISELWNHFKDMHLRYLLNYFYFLPCKEKRAKKLYKRMLDICKSHDYENSKYTICYFDTYSHLDKSGIKEEDGAVIKVNREYNIVYSKHLFEGYEEVPYEGRTVRLPSGNHELLKSQFGDYMQLPPKEDQRSNHVIAFLDMFKK